MSNGQAFWFPCRRSFQRLLLAAVVALSCVRPLVAAPSASKTGFDPRADAFSFKNDTALEYLPDAAGHIVAHRRKGEAGFAHACFILSRAAVQFYQFARFDPRLPKVSDAEYVRLVRQVCRIPVWYPAEPRAIVIPGYRNLHDFSKGREALLKANLGEWLPTYLRVGNWRMAAPMPRAGQQLAAQRLAAALDAGRLQAVYLARNLRMNHCVTLYDYTRQPGGDMEFRLYDPNYAGEPAWLRYHSATRTFELQKRFYFNAGTVNVMRVYISPFH